MAGHLIAFAGGLAGRLMTCEVDHEADQPQGAPRSAPGLAHERATVSRARHGTRETRCGRRKADRASVYPPTTVVVGVVRPKMCWKQRAYERKGVRLAPRMGTVGPQNGYGWPPKGHGWGIAGTRRMGSGLPVDGRLSGRPTQGRASRRREGKRGREPEPCAPPLLPKYDQPPVGAAPRRRVYLTPAGRPDT